MSEWMMIFQVWLTLANSSVSMWFNTIFTNIQIQQFFHYSLYQKGAGVVYPKKGEGGGVYTSNKRKGGANWMVGSKSHKKIILTIHWS